MPRIQLTPEDRERYGGPQWLTVDPTALGDYAAGDLEAVETAFDLTLQEVVHLTARGSVRGLRALVWLAHRKEGGTHTLADFMPRVLAADIEALPGEEELAAGGGAVPPALNRAERRARSRTSSSAAASAN